VRIIRTKEQKDNLAKYCWDFSKIMITALAIAPFAKPETIDLRTVTIGLIVGVFFALFGYILDGMEVQR
jgi:hypothetical protein